jgi:hypothetical protein
MHAVVALALPAVEAFDLAIPAGFACSPASGLMTSELAPAEQRRLQTLPERLLSRLGATTNASPGE